METTFDIDHKTFYEYDKPELKERTRARLQLMSDMGMVLVGFGQFGIPGIMSGLYIEKVWAATDQEFSEYLEWVKALVYAKTLVNSQAQPETAKLCLHLGNWKVGKHASTVVSDVKIKNTNFPSPPNAAESKEDEKEYYGGYLICESIGNAELAGTIAAVPTMQFALAAFVAGMREVENLESPDMLQPFFDTYFRRFCLPLATSALKKSGLL